MAACSVQSNPTKQMTFTFQELRTQVYGSIKESGHSVNGSWKMLSKAALVLGLWGISYAGLLAFGPGSLIATIVGVFSLLFFSLAIELGVMHDASHRSVSKNSLVNRLLSMALTLLGGSSILWFHKHVIHHHCYTNIPGSDPDIYSGGIFRFHDGDPWRPWHRWQYLYALPLYTMLALRWVWIDDFLDTLHNTYGLKGRRFLNLTGELVLARASHITLFFVLPYLASGSILWVLSIYLVHWLLLGVSVSIIFQLAHVTDVQAFPLEDMKPGDDWALHQLATTADFAVGNRFLTWFIGGLNFQVEHHIFPRISHLHYPLVQEIVARYCKEHGIPYHAYPSFFSAVSAHFGHLKRLAVRPGEA
jgi:linoleoyl-CoA desaturase